MSRGQERRNQIVTLSLVRCQRRGSAARARRGRKQVRKCCPRTDSEFRVDLAQVVLYRFRAEEQRGRGLSGGAAARQQQTHLQLLRCERLDRVGTRRPDVLTGRRELGCRLIPPDRDTEFAERVHRAAQVNACVDPSSDATQTEPYASLVRAVSNVSSVCSCHANAEANQPSTSPPACASPDARSARARAQGWPFVGRQSSRGVVSVLVSFLPDHGCPQTSAQRLNQLSTAMCGRSRIPLCPVGKRVGFTPARVRISYPPPLPFLLWSSADPNRMASRTGGLDRLVGVRRALSTFSAGSPPLLAPATVWPSRRTGQAALVTRTRFHLPRVAPAVFLQTSAASLKGAMVGVTECAEACTRLLCLGCVRDAKRRKSPCLGVKLLVRAPFSGRGDRI